MKSDSILSNIRIASPCTVSWEQMTGNDQTRHCLQCNLNVYNFSEMTAQQIEQIITASNGERVCVNVADRGKRVSANGNQSAFTYGSPKAENFPTGSMEWWEAMQREGRTGITTN